MDPARRRGFPLDYDTGALATKWPESQGNGARIALDHDTGALAAGPYWGPSGLQDVPSAPERPGTVPAGAARMAPSRSTPTPSPYAASYAAGHAAGLAATRAAIAAAIAALPADATARAHREARLIEPVRAPAPSSVAYASAWVAGWWGGVAAARAEAVTP